MARAPLERLGRQASVTGDPALSALREEVAAYPAPAHHGEPAGEIAVPLRLRTSRGELAFLSTVASFGTALDVTVSELAIETFLPADAATAEILRSV